MMKLKFFSKLLDKRIAAYQRELIETHYKEVDNMYRQMRGWRHDYRGHIQTMKVLAAQGDLDGIKAYLDALDTDLNTVDLAVKTGNAMADAIINSKISLAKSRNIPVQIDAHIPVKLKMSELDLCCILGNLFDNAMDASAELPEEERLIRVYMDMKKGRPCRPAKEEVEAYRPEAPLDVEVAPRKIVLPKELEDGESFPVRRHQIDTNEHVNNCQYIQMAIDVVPECERAGQIRVEYKKSAVMGDIIYPKMAVEEQRKIVELCDAEGNPYAVVEFKEK